MKPKPKKTPPKKEKHPVSPQARGDTTRTAPMTIRVTPEERARWHACAYLSGLTLSRWVTETLNKEASR